MTVQANVRVYGTPKGAAGVRVVERTGQNALSDPRYGTTFMLGLLQRGPMGVPIPFNSQGEYQDICGDPKDPTWHLFNDGSHLLPDAIDGYYKSGGTTGQLWLIRLDLDGSARRSEIVLKNSVGADCLKISAANEGRWGGRSQQLSKRPIIYATATTFTLYAPDTLANEFVGAIALFTNETGKRYDVVSNTAANASGEAVFTIAAQYSLVADGISGPTSLAGVATYTRYRAIAGTIEYDLTAPISGTATINGRVLTGVGTAFMSELEVGRNLYYNGEARVVDSITSNTTATVTDPFSSSGGGSFEVDNLDVVGTGTSFTTELEVGSLLYAMIDGERQFRVVESIEDDTLLRLSSGFTDSLIAASLEVDNDIVTGVSSQYLSQLQAGTSYLVDPNRSGNAVRVLEVLSNTSVRIEKPFSGNFTVAQITKQALSVVVSLEQQREDGLSVEIGQGIKYPQTHFSMNVRFNGSLVYQLADASLDPNDPLFVEPMVNDDGKNIAYRTGAMNYQKWITVESLWDSAYTTNAQADVRPCNGTGSVLALSDRRIYTVGEFDYQAAVGKLLYPDPYRVPRAYVRVTSAVAPVRLQGTISSSGAIVTGTSTNFRSSLKIGDYLYDPISKTARKIRAIVSQTSLALESAFPANLPALTEAHKAGYVEITQGYNLQNMTQVGSRFLLSFPELLQGGYDGDLAGLMPFYWTKFADLDENVIENAVWGKNLGLVRIACPGISDVVVQKAFAAYAQQYAFEFRAEIPSNYLSASTAEVFINQYLGRNDFQMAAYPSYAFIASPLGKGDRLVSISGDIMGGEASRANLAEGYHQPFAGTDAILSRVIKLPIDVKPQEEAILNLTGIQPIKFMYGNCVVFGARSTAISSLYDFAHIRRQQSNYVRQFLEARELLQQLFKPNQPFTLDQVMMVLDNWALREYRKGAFSRYLSFRQSVEIRGTNEGGGIVDDQETALGLVEIINGKLRVFVSWIPAGIVEELSINLGPDVLVSQYGNSLFGSNL